MSSTAADRRPGRPGRPRRLTAAAVALAAGAIGGIVATAPPASAQAGWRVCGYIAADSSSAVITKISKGKLPHVTELCTRAQDRIWHSHALDQRALWTSVRRMECGDLFRLLNLPDECHTMNYIKSDLDFVGIAKHAYTFNRR